MKATNGLRLVAVVILVTIVGTWSSDQMAKNRGERYWQDSRYFRPRYEAVKYDFCRYATSGADDLYSILSRRNEIVNEIRDDFRSSGISARVDCPEWHIGWTDGFTVDAPEPVIRIYDRWPPKQANRSGERN